MTGPSLLVLLLVLHVAGAVMFGPWVAKHAVKFLGAGGTFDRADRASLVLLAGVWLVAWWLLLLTYAAGVAVMPRADREEVRDGGRRW